QELTPVAGMLKQKATVIARKGVVADKGVANGESASRAIAHQGEVCARLEWGKAHALISPQPLAFGGESLRIDRRIGTACIKLAPRNDDAALIVRGELRQALRPCGETDPHSRLLPLACSPGSQLLGQDDVVLAGS